MTLIEDLPTYVVNERKCSVHFEFIKCLQSRMRTAKCDSVVQSVSEAQTPNSLLVCWSQDVEHDVLSIS